MVKKLWYLLGYVYDCPARYVLLPVTRKLQISLDPSPSRWGFFAVFLAWGFFLLSLFFTMPTPPERGDIMWVFWLGIALIITAVYIGGYFLRHQNQDPSGKQLDRIENKLDRIEQGISETNSKLDRVIELLEELVERFNKWQR
ncbi:hypothetical protein ES703_116220 [subsurface metagenome]